MGALKGMVALVTGASRGAGKGIALELGKAGATVYVTGRSISGSTTNDWPGTINETAAEINNAGGLGIPIQCDHTDDFQVIKLFEKISHEQGKLDLLVNNAWGGSETYIKNKRFWQLPLKHWENMFNAGVRAQLVTNYYAIPLMIETGGKLIVHTTFWDDYKYTGNLYYDLAKNALIRMAYGLSCDLKEHGISVVAVSPGWMRTELVLAEFHTDEDHWTDVEALQRTESTHYIGRAICALAEDKNVFNKTGKILLVGDLAKEYGFTDIDGRLITPFRLED